MKRKKKQWVKSCKRPMHLLIHIGWLKFKRVQCSKEEAWIASRESVRKKLENSAHNQLFIYYPKFQGWYKYNNGCECSRCKLKVLRLDRRGRIN